MKLRGQRLELEGVESVISAHPEVKTAAATILKHPNGSDVLVAYVEPQHENLDSGLEKVHSTKPKKKNNNKKQKKKNDKNTTKEKSRKKQKRKERRRIKEKIKAIRKRQSEKSDKKQKKNKNIIFWKD